MKENFNDADDAEREEARGREEQGRRHAADGNKYLHLRDNMKSEKKMDWTFKKKRKKEEKKLFQRERTLRCAKKNRSFPQDKNKRQKKTNRKIKNLYEQNNNNNKTEEYLNSTIQTPKMLGSCVKCK